MSDLRLYQTRAAINFRRDLVGKRIEGVRFEEREGASWTILTLETGQEVHILDESPWVWVDPEVM